MRNLVFLLMVLTSAQVFSEEAGVGKVFVHAMEDGVDLSELQDKSYVKVNGAGESKSITKELPPPHILDKMLKEAGLQQQTNHFDQLDKDIFFMKVQRRDMSYLSKSYPDFSKGKLEKLKSLLGAFK